MHTYTHMHTHTRRRERHPSTKCIIRNVGPTNRFLFLIIAGLSIPSSSTLTHMYRIPSFYLDLWYLWFCGQCQDWREDKKRTMFKEDFTLLCAYGRVPLSHVFPLLSCRSAMGCGVGNRRTWREKTKMGFCFSLEAKIPFIFNKFPLETCHMTSHLFLRPIEWMFFGVLDILCGISSLNDQSIFGMLCDWGEEGRNGAYILQNISLLMNSGFYMKKHLVLKIFQWKLKTACLS